MYHFYYKYIKNRYNNKAALLFVDTCSLIYEIETENFYEDFFRDKEVFEFRNCLKESKHYYTSNLVLGKMKDEKQKD